MDWGATARSDLIHELVGNLGWPCWDMDSKTPHSTKGNNLLSSTNSLGLVMSSAPVMVTRFSGMLAVLPDLDVAGAAWQHWRLDSLLNCKFHLGGRLQVDEARVNCL